MGLWLVVVGAVAVQETLRIYSVVPHVTRIATRTVVRPTSAPRPFLSSCQPAHPSVAMACV